MSAVTTHGDIQVPTPTHNQHTASPPQSPSGIATDGGEKEVSNWTNFVGWLSDHKTEVGLLVAGVIIVSIGLTMIGSGASSDALTVTVKEVGSRATTSLTSAGRLVVAGSVFVGVGAVSTALGAGMLIGERRALQRHQAQIDAANPA